MLPVGVLLFLVFWLMLFYLMKPEVGRLAELDIEALQRHHMDYADHGAFAGRYACHAFWAVCHCLYHDDD